MEHSEAIETDAAERYLLDEMAPEDRDAFEEHFFGCVECAGNVRDNARVAAVIRTGAAERAPRRNHLASAGIAASVVLALILAYQNSVTIPHLRAERDVAREPRVIRTFSLLTAAARSVEETVTAHADESFSLDFEIPPSPNAERYAVAVTNEAHHPLLTRTVSRADALNTVRLLIPAGSLPPGRYSLTARPEPASHAPVPEWSFVVVR
jgi:hypothetical protein